VIGDKGADGALNGGGGVGVHGPVIKAAITHAHPFQCAHPLYVALYDGTISAKVRAFKHLHPKMPCPVIMAQLIY
jgi:hypothetical protein